MKLTKGKLSKLFNKKKQSHKRAKNKKNNKNNSFRKNAHLNLANKTLKNNQSGGKRFEDGQLPEGITPGFVQQRKNELNFRPSKEQAEMNAQQPPQLPDQQPAPEINVQPEINPVNDDDAIKKAAEKAAKDASLEDEEVINQEEVVDPNEGELNITPTVEQKVVSDQQSLQPGDPLESVRAPPPGLSSDEEDKWSRGLSQQELEEYDRYLEQSDPNPAEKRMKVESLLRHFRQIQNRKNASNEEEVVDPNILAEPISNVVSDQENASGEENDSDQENASVQENDSEQENASVQENAINEENEDVVDPNQDVSEPNIEVVPDQNLNSVVEEKTSNIEPDTSKESIHKALDVLIDYTIEEAIKRFKQNGQQNGQQNGFISNNIMANTMAENLSKKNTSNEEGENQDISPPEQVAKENQDITLPVVETSSVVETLPVAQNETSPVVETSRELKRINREIDDLTDEFEVNNHDTSNRILTITYNGDTYTIDYSTNYPFDPPSIKKNNRSVSFSSELWTPATTLQQLIKDINEKPQLYLINNEAPPVVEEQAEAEQIVAPSTVEENIAASSEGQPENQAPPVVEGKEEAEQFVAPPSIGEETIPVNEPEEVKVEQVQKLTTGQKKNLKHKKTRKENKELKEKLLQQSSQGGKNNKTHRFK